MNKFKYDICIFGGLGHVGLPLGIMFASKGFKVLLFDKHEENIKLVSKAKMPFIEYGAQSLLKKNLNKRLFISKEYKDVFDCENIIKKISKDLTKNHNMIIRSSVFPGTMKVIHNILSKKN